MFVVLGLAEKVTGVIFSGNYINFMCCHDYNWEGRQDKNYKHLK